MASIMGCKYEVLGAVEKSQSFYETQENPSDFFTGLLL